MRRIFHAALCLLALFGLLALTACSSPSGSTGGPSAKKIYKIGFANLSEDVSFAVSVRQGIEAAAKQAGNIQLVEADNRLSGATALANAENFITQGVDGVIEFQTDESFGNVIMDKFRAHNIPVIAIDIPMPGATFFGADNYHAGSIAGQGLGQWVKQNWAGQIDALISLDLPQSGAIPAARMQGQLEGLEVAIGTIATTKIRHLDSKNTEEVARNQVTDVLTTLPNLHHIAVISINDETAAGAIDAAKAAGRLNDVAVVGQGADQLGIAEIHQYSQYIGTTAYFPEKYGYQIIPAILGLVQNKPEPPSIYVHHIFLTKGNISQYYPNS